jgi:hypothetical protein
MSCAKKLLQLALVVLALPSGCKSRVSEDPAWLSKKGELTDIYDMYAMFVKKNQRPPQQAADLTGRGNEQISPAGVRALQKQDAVVFWGVDISSKDSGKVLAYEKDAPSQGGAVLMADGTVRKMSAEDLKAAIGPR